MSDDWSSFQALEDDEDDDVIVFGKRLDKTAYAVEDDAAETKAAVGASRSAPKIEWDAEPIQVLAGTIYIYVYKILCATECLLLFFLACP